MSNQCKHGALSRVCRICELEAEVERLREALRAVLPLACEALIQPSLSVEILDAYAALKEPK